MKTLLNDSSIVIRPADKGSGIVIMNTEGYTHTLEKEMKDNGTYVEVTEDNTKRLRTKLKTGQTNTQGQDDNGQFKLLPYAIWRNEWETAW